MVTDALLGIVALLGILVLELGLVVVWALREQRSANHYRGRALTLQGDRLDVELVRWAGDRGKLVVASLDPDRDPEREKSREQSNGFHASRIAGGSDAS